MPVVFQKIIRNEDLRRNPRVLYAYPTNLQNIRTIGLSAECWGEPNAVGIATRYSPIEAFGDSIAEILAQKTSIDRCFKPLFATCRAGGIVIWPSPSFDTDLPLKAPTTYAHFEDKLRALIKVGELHDPLKESR